MPEEQGAHLAAPIVPPRTHAAEEEPLKGAAPAAVGAAERRADEVAVVVKREVKLRCAFLMLCGHVKQGLHVFVLGRYAV